MKNEYSEYFTKHKDKINDYIEDAKYLISNNRVHDDNTYNFCYLLSEFVKTDLFENENFLGNIKQVIDPNTLQDLIDFASLEKEFLLKLEGEMKYMKAENVTKLIDIEWKFVASSSLDNFEINELQPRILLKLIFSNGTHKFLESDFANFKKLQEELEEGVSSYNYTYSRRIETFSK